MTLAMIDEYIKSITESADEHEKELVKTIEGPAAHRQYTLDAMKVSLLINSLRAEAINLSILKDLVQDVAFIKEQLTPTRI